MTAFAPGFVPHSARQRSLLGAMLLLCFFNLVPARAGNKDLVPVTMMVGFTTAAFLQSNRNDVEAALKVLCETIGRKRGYQVTMTSQSFHNAADFDRAIEAGEINFAVFDSLAFVATRHPGDLTPVYIPITTGTRGRRYLLLVRRDSGLRTLADLRGKSIVELQAPDLSVGHTWLSSLLLAQGLGANEKFFRSIGYVDRSSAAVLPVFFGRQDACLVDDLAFKLMVELNPQVGALLQTVEISVPLVGGVMCVSEANWPTREFRPALLKTLGELHLEPAGRQILTLFKMDQMVPYEETYLDSARELWSTYTRLRKEVRP